MLGIACRLISPAQTLWCSDEIAHDLCVHAFAVALFTLAIVLRVCVCVCGLLVTTFANAFVLLAAWLWLARAYSCSYLLILARDLHCLNYPRSVRKPPFQSNFS